MWADRRRGPRSGRRRGDRGQPAARLWRRVTLGLTLSCSIVVGLGARPAAAEDGSKRCRGGKQFYQGECRYPDEIQRLQAEAARQRAAEAARRKAEKERKAQEKEAEEKKARDVVACSNARQADSLTGWQQYQTDFPDGTCAQEAAERIAALQPKQAPTAPPPTPPPPMVPTEVEESSAEISPLVWIGLGVGVAGLVTFGVAGGVAMHRESKLADECPDASCAPDQQDALDKAMLSAHVSTVGLIIGGMGVTILTIGLVLPGDDDAEGPTAAEPAAEPEPQAESAALQLLLRPGSVGLRAQF